MLKNLPSWVPQVLAVFLACLSCLSDGMHYGWSAPIIPILESPDTPMHITHTDITWIEITNMMGGFCGLPVTIFFVDKIGRKNSILMSACIGVCCWILLATAQRIEQILVARFFSGIAGDVAFVATPMFVAEIADQNLRGRLSGTTYLMMLVGLLIVYVVAPFVKIWVSSMVGLGILLVQLCTFSFIPQSPYYLLMKDRKEDAKRALQWFRSKEDVEEEIADIAAAVTRQQTEKGRPQDLILIPSNRKAITIMSVLNGAQHFTGISVILMNVHSILSAAESVYLDYNITAIVFAILMLVAASLAVCFVDKFGRKILLITSSFLTGLSLTILAGFFAFKNAGFNTTSYSIIPTLAVMFYAVVFKAGLGIIPIILTGELFPTSVKAIGMTVADAMYVILSIISVYLYQWLSEAFGIHVPLFIFAGSSILTAAFSAFFVPETKGKTLEEIQMILKGINPAYVKNEKEDEQEKENEKV